jgi:membrane protein implicated in regulation of membrane protease activity
MRRLLNLNHLGIPFLTVIGLLLLVVPAALYAILLLWSQAGAASSLLWGLIRLSLGFGALALVTFLVLLAAEQVQDHLFDTGYRRQRGRKVALGNGLYECQYCGNRRVAESDTSCRVCGRELQPAGWK